MKRFGRIAIGVLAAVSLALFTANAAWWARSYFMADVILRLSTDNPPGVSRTQPATRYVARRIMAFAPMRGRVQIGYSRQSRASFTLLPDGWMSQSVPTRMVMASKAPWKTLGFGYDHQVVPVDVIVTENGVPIQGPATAQPLAESWNLWVPCWFIAVLTAIGPVVWFRKWSKRYYQGHGVELKSAVESQSDLSLGASLHAETGATLSRVSSRRRPLGRNLKARGTPVSGRQSPWRAFLRG